MGYDRSDSFPFDFEPNGFLFGNKEMETYVFSVQRPGADDVILMVIRPQRNAKI